MPLEPCEKRAARVSSTALVRYRGNDYSVPTAYGFQDVHGEGLRRSRSSSCAAAQEIARHQRSYGSGIFVFDPLHYLALIETKPNALDQAAPLKDWDLPEAFQHLRHLLEARMGNRGKREFIQVLRLLEAIPKESWRPMPSPRRSGSARSASMRSSRSRWPGSSAGPARLDLTAYPHLPKTRVKIDIGGRLRRSRPRESRMSGKASARRDAGGNDERHAAGAARPSPQATEAADRSAGV